MFTYEQSYDTSISDHLKKRFWQEIEVLEQEGFRFFSVHKETIWPFSVILFFPVYLLMAANEYVRIETPLRISSYHLMYISEDGSTLAYVYGLGCKFYTKFLDGTWVVTNTVQKMRDEKVVTLKREEEPLPTGQIWKKHCVVVQEYREKGKLPAPRVSFDHWVDIESRFDRNNARSVLGLGMVWMAFLAWAIYWAATNGRSIIDKLF